MNDRRWRWLLLAGVGWLGAAAAADAQPAFRPPAPPPPPPAIDPPKGSHRPLNDGLDLTSPEQALADRLHRSQQREQVDKLLQTLLQDPKLLQAVTDAGQGLTRQDLEMLKAEAAKNPGLLDDPALRDLAAQAAKDKNHKPSDEQVQQLKNLAEAVRPKDPAQGPPGGPPPGVHLPPAMPPGMMPPGYRPSTPPPAPPPEPPDQGKTWIDGAADLFRGLGGGPEGDSLNDLFHQLGRRDGDGGASGSSELNGFFSSAAKELARWDLGGHGHDAGLPDAGAWAGAPPAGSSASGPDAAGMLWVLAAALVGVGAWLAVSRLRRGADAARARRWSPGPWPVDPAAVATRGDLIRAFEHLAYLVIGREARPLNHRAAAARIGRTAAVERLARLYEQARYAPPGEPLPADELAAARRDLGALAGAAA
jgi:hypothetical protein